MLIVNLSLVLFQQNSTITSIHRDEKWGVNGVCRKRQRRVYRRMVPKSSDAAPLKHLCALHLLNFVLVCVKVLVSTKKTATHCGDGIKASANGVCLTLYSRSPVLSDGCGFDPGWTTASRGLYGPFSHGPSPGAISTRTFNILQLDCDGHLLPLRQIKLIWSHAVNSTPHDFPTWVSCMNIH